MRAPDRRFFGYTDAQWAAIAAVVDPAISLSALAECLARARDFLTYIGELYAGMPARRGMSEPPWRRAQRRKKVRAALVAARAALDDYDLGLGVEQAIEARKQARAALDVVITNINVAIAVPRAGNKNAEQVHIQ
jgi:hypothetical protein